MNLHFLIFRQTKFLTCLLTAACLFACIQTASAGNCDNPRYAAKNQDECGDPTEPPGQEKVLEVTVFFGDMGAGDPLYCTNPDYCVPTTFKATGSVICSSQVCDFQGSVTTPTEFNIPPSIFNLLSMTKIRGTAIKPEECFDIPESGVPNGTNLYDYVEPGSTKAKQTVNGEEIDVIWTDDSGIDRKLTYEFFLRSPVVAGPDQKWYAKVSAVSTDMAGVPQRYIFHLGGDCESHDGQCPALSGSDFEGYYEEGWGGGVFGTNTNRRGEPQTCRCTVSSKPSCPDNVDMGVLPRPASRIYITDNIPTT